jgi:replicative DNA helicase
VALGGVNGVNRFLGLVKKHRPATTFILLMDNDKAGEGAMQKARAGLAELGAKFAEVKLKDAHDANELLQKDAEALKKFVAGCKAMAPSAEELAEEAATAYSAGFASSKVADFLEIMGGKGAVPPISTGIPQLDEALDGGLYSGLHILGAISSLGKTTFMLQLADSMAASGIDVLFFSLETPYTELMAKSISRSTFVNQKKMPKAYPQTARNVLCNRLQKHGKVLLEGDEKAATTQLLVQCIGEYANGAAKCIRFIDRQHSCGVQDIAEAIAEHRKYRPDRRLVVFVDYLQILAKASERYTDKQNTDEALKALSILAKNEKLPMLVISSINRTSYTEPIGLTSFKESGNIEYDAEVAIGLQYEGMDYEDDADSEETEKARKSRIRKLIKEQEAKGYRGEAQQIQLKVLKNRLAPKTKCSADFWPAYSFFDFGRGFSSTGSGDEDEADSWTV